MSLAELNGKHFLDRWEIMGNYTDCMIGNPDVIVINDAWQKGIRDFDTDKAYSLFDQQLGEIRKREIRLHAWADFRDDRVRAQ